ncbi:acyltransferase [Bradyrhizobium sp. 199]|uniref:acyltransferase family protein n=1 Tax=Bradyrhizobium sp. 199 TaxID=2782664 RepID=UPI001FFB5331|nr:acyltransferase [Bradyrhizobium sp. 199]MCK1362221.1 acyltransferase [Bradyrhizobium sp. 199]
MNELNSLQYLRAIASIAVVFFHCGGKARIDFTVGQSGVDLFFIISGFLMMVITNERSNPREFLRRRLQRIVPLYWVVTTVLLIGAVAGFFPSVRLTAWHIVSSYLFIPSVSPSNGHIYPLLVPGWTLVYEMFFYLSFSMVLCLRTTERRRLILLTTVFVVLIAAGQKLEPEQAILKTFTPMLLEFFLAGCWIGLAWKEGYRIPSFFSAIFIGIGVLLLSATMLYGRFAIDHRLLFYGVPMLLVFVGVLRYEQIGAVREWPMLHFLGNASYSIYLWHTLAISAAAKVAIMLGIGDISTFAFLALAGIVVGSIGYALLERPVLTAIKLSGRATPGGVQIAANLAVETDFRKLHQQRLRLTRLPPASDEVPIEAPAHRGGGQLNPFKTRR